MVYEIDKNETQWDLKQMKWDSMRSNIDQMRDPTGFKLKI
jgi:hypothetical protein